MNGVHGLMLEHKMVGRIWRRLEMMILAWVGLHWLWRRLMVIVMAQVDLDGWEGCDDGTCLQPPYVLVLKKIMP